ncbi:MULTISPECIES: Fe-S cluster assembly protein SufD [Citricoccus]|uniref:Fe-S cluster assembly protein SufD n=1 Tax=Citricoccus muralis TaxID=169134 RepID=A0ABY8HAI6_9MICC|nr:MULTISPECIES: Fe-S cluster assembly protein SufD [Citricoccus]WBL20679.1 Fe-S cluster assembly protein SufD [Citricoccus sp. NR2]WFP17921.1 Fe-S cluster assembly protein SufD [Citricoccus muralis]
MGEEGEQLSAEIAAATQSEHADHSVKEKKQKFGTSRADRPTSFHLADFPVLTGREEDWRFTPLERLGGLDLPEGDEQRLQGAAPTVEVSSLEGLTVETVSRDDARLGQAMTPEDRTSAAAWASFSEATVITLGDGVEAEEPIRIQITGTDATPAAQHILIIAGDNAKADFLITHRGNAVLAQNIEYDVREGASINVTSVHAWDAGAVQTSSQQASLAKDSAYKHIAISYGGSLVRLTPTARFTQPGGEAEMYGLYFADAGQHLEQRLFVDHAVPNCTSNVLYKGALQGRDAHTVWVGDVLIRKAAEGTDSYEKNQNLVLTDGARADSIPNLEIETGVIDGAGHASSTGRFDEEQLFYLMARGITEKEARKLIVRGFLNEIIQRIGIDDVEAELTQVMESELKMFDR